MISLKKPRFKTAYDFLKQDKQCLGYLQHHCDLLKKMQACILRYLAEPLHPYCQILNYEKGILKLQCESSAWASRLRFELPHLKRYLIKETVFLDLVKIDIVVRPVDERALTADDKKTPHRLSQKAKDVLQDCAAHLPEGDLKTIVDKLSR
jgi:hypothetical protein